MKKSTTNSSARRKLIPAVAMLTTSAIMLSTATYAWFTMNKTVEVTGLSMTATTADALEISLGGYGADNAITFTAQPADTVTEKSWTNAITIGEYYSKIGKIIPSSTTNCAKMFYTTDATNGGQIATKFGEVTAAANKALVARTTYDAAGALATPTDADDTGYYVDIPVFLRTSKVADATTTDADIYCIMNITGDTDEELYKAARVAFINDANGNGVVDTDETSAAIWGADATYYHSGDTTPLQGIASIDGEGIGTRGAVTVVTDTNVNNGKATGLSIPLAATTGSYGHANFVMRVWLEGESTFCKDANAAQDWNIDMKFAIDNADTSFVAFT